MAEANVNPTVTVPVAAVNFLNMVIGLLGEAMSVTVMEQEIDGHGFLENAWVHVEWEDDVPKHLMDRVEAATEEVNTTIADNPLVGVCTGDEPPLNLFIRTE
jgi:hypothetical protein